MVARSFSLQGMAPAIVFDAGGLTVRAVLVDHDPVKPAVAYRFDYGGRSLVVSGDLDAVRQDLDELKIIVSRVVVRLD